MSDIKDPRFVSSMFPLVSTKGAIGFDSIERGEIRKVINSHLKMVLLTNPGELISDSSFGVGIYQHLFLLETEPKLKNLQNLIESQIDTYLPYLSRYQVTVDSTKVMDHKLAVRIEYIITEEQRVETTDFIVTEGSTLVVTDSAGGSVSLSLGEVLGERA